MTIYYFLFAIGIFVVLRYLSRVVGSLTSNRAVYKILIRLYPVVELLVWLAFGLWVINRLFSNFIYYPVLVSAVAVGIVLIIGWYFLRDFISGVILKAEIPFEKNQNIGVLHYQGVLRKIGYRSIEIEIHNGELIKIPYSQLAAGAIHLFNNNDSLQTHELSLSVSSSIPMQEVRDRITKSLFLLPWVAINKDPSINLVEQTPTHNILSISYHTTSSIYASNVNQYLAIKFDEFEL